MNVLQITKWTVLRSARFRDRKEEGRSLARFALEPDPAAMMFDDLFRYRKSDTGAFILHLGMETLEHLEHSVPLCRGDADTVVLDGEGPFVASISC